MSKGYGFILLHIRSVKPQAGVQKSAAGGSGTRAR